MLFSDIYQMAVLSNGTDPDLTPKKLAPILAERFKHLWDNKIIYHERVTMILTLLETNITPELIQFKARRAEYVLDHSNHRKFFMVSLKNGLLVPPG